MLNDDERFCVSPLALICYYSLMPRDKITFAHLRCCQFTFVPVLAIVCQAYRDAAHVNDYNFICQINSKIS